MTFRRHFVGLALAVTLSACAGATATPTPSAPPAATPSASPSPAPTPSPTQPQAGVTSAAQAAALVFASDPHFGSIRPADPGGIGACCTYEAVDAGRGYVVTIEVGWGDCPAGCISHHRWQFHVDPDGTLVLIEQSGDPEPPVPAGEGSTASATLHVRAGPTCPVQPAPNCEERPVANAEVVIRDPAGRELDTATSNEAGEIGVQLPPGAYYLEPQPVDGLVGTAPAVAFSVVAGETADINIEYDTGIR